MRRHFLRVLIMLAATSWSGFVSWAQAPSPSPAGDVQALRDEPAQTGGEARLLKDASGRVLTPYKVLVATDFSQAPALAGDAKLILLRGMVDALSQSKNFVRIGEPNRLTTIPQAAKQAETGRFDVLVFAIFSQNTTTGELATEVFGAWIPSQVEFFRLKIDPVVPDPRFRNLGADYWRGLTGKANEFLTPKEAVSTLVVEAQPGSVVTALNKDYEVGADGLVQLPITAGSTVAVEVRKPGTFKVRQTILIGDGSLESDKIWHSPQQAYNNSFYLDLGFLDTRFIMARIGLPIVDEALYASIGFNFLGFGLNDVIQPTPSAALFADARSIEVGGGINWYINGRFADFRLTLGLEALARIDLHGQYFIDDQAPVALHVPFGFEVSLSREVAFYFQDQIRYVFAGNPESIVYASNNFSSSKSNSSHDDPITLFSRVIGAKFVVGPGYLMPFVPTFGFRVQL